MNRSEFEAAARAQNEKRAAEVVAARQNAEPCEVVTMFAFGGMDYCRTHRVMGPCPWGRK